MRYRPDSDAEFPEDFELFELGLEEQRYLAVHFVLCRFLILHDFVFAKLQQLCHHVAGVIRRLPPVDGRVEEHVCVLLVLQDVVVAQAVYQFVFAALAAQRSQLVGRQRSLLELALVVVLEREPLLLVDKKALLKVT